MLQIYDLETAYLEETKDTGNIFTGWNMSANAEKGKSKKSTQNEDRHFSLSSITSPASRREESKKVSVLQIDDIIHIAIVTDKCILLEWRTSWKEDERSEGGGQRRRGR